MCPLRAPVPARGATTVAPVADVLVPILRVADGAAAAPWYARLGFSVVGEHRFAPDLPLYLFLRRNDVHLSEHEGDARPGTLVSFYVDDVEFYVDDVEPIATEFGVEILEEPWAREIELTDLDGNRLRIGTSTTTED